MGSDETGALETEVVTFAVDPKLIEALPHSGPLDVVLETGTLPGDTGEAVRRCFRESYSIEMSEPFREATRSRFDGDASIHILRGDSPWARSHFRSTLS